MGDRPQCAKASRGGRNRSGSWQVVGIGVGLLLGAVGFLSVAEAADELTVGLSVKSYSPTDGLEMNRPTLSGTVSGGSGNFQWSLSVDHGLYTATVLGPSPMTWKVPAPGLAEGAHVATLTVTDPTTLATASSSLPISIGPRPITADLQPANSYTLLAGEQLQAVEGQSHQVSLRVSKGFQSVNRYDFIFTWGDGQPATERLNTSSSVQRALHSYAGLAGTTYTLEGRILNRTTGKTATTRRTVKVIAWPDLRGRVIGAPVFLGKDPTKPGRLRFTVELTNASHGKAIGRAWLIPFLLPLADPPHGNKGVVLAPTSAKLNLGPGQSTTAVSTVHVPKVAQADYRLAVLIDHANTIPEMDERNNVTDLVPAGVLGTTRPLPVRHGAQDFYSEIQGAAIAQGGGVDHTLRTIYEGALDSYGEPLWRVAGESHSAAAREDHSEADDHSEELWARFMLADLASGRIYTLVEDEGVAEKQFFSLFWDYEQDPLGRPTRVDYYYQSPTFDGVPPGRYRFLTFMDSHDRFPEHDEWNNLDSHPFTLSPLEMVDYPDTWFVAQAGGVNPTPETLVFRNGFNQPLEWTISVSEGASWLSVAHDHGMLNVDEPFATQVVVDASGLPVGRYTAEVKVVADGYEGFPLTIPVYLSVHGDTAPINNTSPRYLEFSTPQGIHPEAKTFRIANPGTKPLHWEARPDVYFISVAPTTGVVNPGKSQTVQVIIHPEGLEPDAFEVGAITVFCDATNDHPVVDVELTIDPLPDELIP